MKTNKAKSKTKKILKIKTVKTAKVLPEALNFKDTLTSFTPKNPAKVKKYAGAFLIVVAIAGLLYYFRGQFVVAIVNGKPVTRYELVKELESQAGQKTLDVLITKTLLLQEAKKKNISVSQQEVDDEIKKLEADFTKNGQNLNQLLLMQGMTREALAEQIKLQKLAEKLVENDVTVSDQEVADYLKQNTELLSKDKTPQEQEAEVRDQLKQQKLSEKIQELLGKLRDSAKITYWWK